MAKMTKVSCTRKIHFCSGHRVFRHEGKCANPHGHNYYAHITAEADELDSVGRVIDFSVLKEKVGSWIETNWDHTFIAFKEDIEMLQALKKVRSPKPPFIAPFNPTAENMARYLLTVVCPEVLQGSTIKVAKVVIYETDNCCAEVVLEESVCHSF
jgi:6-pyruvoyltetrahydropterin/6-carboxytetrahydropterin synthase